MSDSRTVLPATKLLNLIGVRADENAVTLIARASPRAARCPVGAKQSARVHSSWYTRTLADLPWQGIPVSVRLLHVRRFFCDERTCDERTCGRRAIFAERLSGVVAYYRSQAPLWSGPPGAPTPPGRFPLRPNGTERLWGIRRRHKESARGSSA